VLLSYKEFRAKFWNGIATPSSTVYCIQVTYRLSRELAFIFYRLGISPNTISGLSFLSAMVAVGAILFFPTSLGAQILALIMFQLCYALDCADGQVARAAGKATQFGKFLDLVLDRFNNFLAFTGYYAAYVLSSAGGGGLGGLLWGEPGSGSAPVTGVDPRELLLFFLAFSGYQLFVITNMIRGFVWSSHQGFARRAMTRSLVRRIITLPYELMDQGVHFLMLSLAYIFGLILPALWLYGFLGWVMFLLLLIVLKRNPLLEQK